MAAFLKALGLENKPEYTEKIPEALSEKDFRIHDVSDYSMYKSESKLYGWLYVRVHSGLI